MNFLLLYKNTILMIFFRIVCAVVTSSMAGICVRKVEVQRFRNRFFVGVVPNDDSFPDLHHSPVPDDQQNGIAKTPRFALVFPGLVSAFGTFLMRQAYKILPKDLEEAARLDGLNIGENLCFDHGSIDKIEHHCAEHLHRCVWRTKN
jgi:multiple sugar transport system permease protein